MKKIGSIIVIVLVLGGIWFVLPNPAAQEENLENLKRSAETEDYQAFADYLKIAYEKGWAFEPGIPESEDDLNAKQSEVVKVESKAYIKETEYFNKGDLDRSLRVSTIIYENVPGAWRFRYLRIRTLEKLGRNALDAGDLEKSEDYAKQILAIMFRREGADLLADVYIKKLEMDRDNKDKTQAIKDYNFITGYQLTPEKLERINQLRAEIEKL